jgi:sugar lactone lactonase YvrE
LSRTAPAAVDGLRVAVAAENLIGESPVWSVREQALYWVDVEGKRVQRFAPESGSSTDWKMPEVTSSIGLRCDAGLVAATRTGFVFIDTIDSEISPITHPEADLPGNRFNDGKVDRAGRFFAGTKNLANNAQPTGTLYRLEADRRAHAVTHGISCTNGIAWSPDDRTMYLCDTWVRRIYSFDFDAASGNVANRRVFAELSAAEGYPTASRSTPTASCGMRTTTAGASHATRPMARSIACCACRSSMSPASCSVAATCARCL